MARHVKNNKNKRHGVSFWDQEYTNPEHLSMSVEVSGDLEKFTRWLERQTKRTFLNPTASVVDFGCGNGRNLLYLAGSYGMHGIGNDSSSAAIKEAKMLAEKEGANLQYEVRTMAGTHPRISDNSQTLALDMMSSHFLNKGDRALLRDEIFRVLKPGGYLFMKTFLKDGDIHTARLIEEKPGTEESSYIHPVIGVQEHVYSEDELIDFLGEKFVIHRTYPSHKHKSKGKARKRRTISVYAQKSAYDV
ncbi:MAG: SAM-dependent methyltransferase [Acidimicrobiales bacterium]|jgi:SAM-dependent methyltransferase